MTCGTFLIIEAYTTVSCPKFGKCVIDSTAVK